METKLLQRIRALTLFFMVGLVLSGLTAIPLQWQLETATRWLGVGEHPDSAWGGWLGRVTEGVVATNRNYPFISYGTDWLAFGHFAIALVFVGAWRDPVRNIWLFQFGLLACLLVVPYAFVFGGLRGIPVFWRLIDCSFGVFGAIPMAMCLAAARKLEAANPL